MNLFLVFLFFLVDLCILLCLPIMFFICLLVSLFTVCRGKGFCVNVRNMMKHLMNVETFSEKFAHFPAVFLVVIGVLYLMEYIFGWGDILFSGRISSKFFLLMILCVTLFGCSLVYTFIYYYYENLENDGMRESLIESVTKPPEIISDISSDSHDSEIEELLKDDCCNYYCCSLKGGNQSFCPLFYILRKCFTGCGYFCNCLDRITTSECCCFCCLCMGNLYYNFGNLG